MALARASTKRLSWRGRLESALYRWARCFSFSRMVRVGLWFSSITTRAGNRSSDCAFRIFRVRLFAPRIAGPAFLEISRSLGVRAHRDHLHLPRRKAAILSHHFSFAPDRIDSRFFTNARSLELDCGGDAGFVPLH